MALVKVCDAMMGAGKTQSAIAMMNGNPDSRFLFVTPYLEEVERIIRECGGRGFKQPAGSGGTKYDSFLSLLKDRENIASTHALFRRYTKEAAELIRAGEYVLVMDEVFGVLEEVGGITVPDIKNLLDTGIVRIAGDGYHVEWTDRDRQGGRYEDIRNGALSRTLLMADGNMLFWEFPPRVFSCFKDVYLLTYMFRGQVQRAYFESHGIKYRYIGTRCVNGSYQFTEEPWVPETEREFKKKVHILEDGKLNKVGDGERALSKNWFKGNKAAVRTLGLNLYNVFHNRYKCGAEDILWTTFKTERKKLSGKGYASRFVSCNMRAQNKYSGCHHLGYCVNRYLHPNIANYFRGKGVNVYEDEFALSEMVQWIWRSAIRNGEDIWLYVPSGRMRGLLKGWLDGLERGVLF